MILIFISVGNFFFVKEKEAFSHEKCSFQQIIKLPELEFPSRTILFKGIGLAGDIVNELIPKEKRRESLELTKKGRLTECLEFELVMKDIKFFINQSVTETDGNNQTIRTENNSISDESIDISGTVVGTLGQFRRVGRMNIFKSEDIKHTRKVSRKISGGPINFDQAISINILGKGGELACGETKVLNVGRQVILIVRQDIRETVTVEIDGKVKASESINRNFSTDLGITAIVTLTLKCHSECCPQDALAPSPQDQPGEEGGTLIGPTPTEEEGVEAPPTGDIGPQGGAGGAGSTPVDRTCNSFQLEGAVALREGERVTFTIRANFFPNKDEMFSQFVGFSVLDSSFQSRGFFGRQIHAGVESNFGSTSQGDVSQEVTSSVSADGRSVTVSIPGAAVPPGAIATVQSGCMQTSAGPFQDKSSLHFDIPIQ